MHVKYACARRQHGQIRATQPREYTRNGHQSQKGRENIPIAGTNHRRHEFPQQQGRGKERDVIYLLRIYLLEM
eukprot:1841383-Pyramimonas_sp.AAC.1